MARFATLLVFLLALFAACYSSFAETRDRFGGGFEARFESWMPIALAAIIIGFLFNAAEMMLGFALQSEEIKRSARAELLQTTASSFMILFAVTLLYSLTAGGGSRLSAFDLMGHVLGTGSYIDCAAAPAGKLFIWESGPMGAFKCKVQEKIDALEVAYDNIAKSNKKQEALLSVCYSIFGAPVYCYSWDLALHQGVEEAHLIATKIVGLLVPLHAQYALAEYIEQNMLAVFLPLGLLLRIFPFSRGVGGLLIAISIGMFFIWPTFFLLTDPTFVKKDAPGVDTLEGMCLNGFKGTAVVRAGVFGGGPSDLSLLNGKALIYQITVATMFYPFVALVLALIFIRAMTPLLGGDMGELMKMVARLG